jgi:hypothetical protein
MLTERNGQKTDHDNSKKSIDFDVSTNIIANWCGYFYHVDSKSDVVVKIRVLGPETKMYSDRLIFQDWANNFYRFLSLPE